MNEITQAIQYVKDEVYRLKEIVDELLPGDEEAQKVIQRLFAVLEIKRRKTTEKESV